MGNSHTPEIQHTPQPQTSIIPPYPERLAIEKLVVQPRFDFESEFRNVCIQIRLLQAIRYVPIYSNMIRELCLKKPGRKQKDPLAINVVGQLSDYISDQPLLPKFANPGNPILTVSINNIISIENALIDLPSAINIMSISTL